MAVGNSLSGRANATVQNRANAITKYESNGAEITLTPAIVRNYLVSGDKERVTFEELAMFINLCKYSGLNPWLREAYCIKYGNEPATMVVGKDAFAKRAENNPAYDGMESGIITLDKQSGEITYRNGTVKLPGEEILGGWAEVWRKDRNHTTRAEVSFEEYAGRKKDGSMNGQWSQKPATMIRKVAQVQALREAFPTMLSGAVTAEEAGAEESNETAMPIQQPVINAETGEVEEPKVQTPAPAQGDVEII